MSERLSRLQADQTTLAAHAGGAVAIGGRAYPRSDALVALGSALDRLPMTVNETRRFELGNYRGLRFGLVLHPNFAPEAYLEGEGRRLEPLSREHHGPRAILNAVERLAGGCATACTGLKKELDVARAQLRDYQARLGIPFAHDGYLAELTSLRDALKARLSGSPSEPAGETGPGVGELAGRIKALRAAHAIDAPPGRAPQKQAAAEEPVTTRIRRRAASRVTESVDSKDASHTEPQRTFQDREAASSRRLAPELSPR
jgi:hypothetical protein